MRAFTFLRELLADLRQQRLRTLLTVMGITWGTTAVVVLLAFGVGLQRSMVRNAKGIGDAIAIVGGGRTTKPFHGFNTGRPIELHEDDAALLAREVPEIDAIGPEYGRWGVQARRGKAASNVYLTGITPAYGDLRNVFAQAGGRFIDDVDIATRRRVAFMGNELKRLLFADEDPIGKTIFVDAAPFTVVGVMVEKTQNSSYNSRDQDRLFIPASTYVSIYGATTVNRIIYRPDDPRTAADVSQHVREVLGRRYAFDPADRDALNIWDTADQLKFFKYLFLGFNLFLGIVGSFTLVVGGIGVANVMYVVVQERTREIGLRRSVGARRRDVLSQVLIEALLIVGFGALLGFLISGGIVLAGRLLPLEDFVGDPTISPLVFATTAALLTAVALLAGYLPARRAALLDPVDALRYGA